MVWICLTPNAYAYHYDSDCRGLNNCKGDKKKVSLEDAQKKIRAQALRVGGLTRGILGIKFNLSAVVKGY